MIPDLVEAKRVLSEERYQAGEAMFLRGGVREDAIGENQLRYMVHDTPARMVTIGRGPGACCNCEEYHEKGSCIHVVAALLKARGSGALGEMEHRYARSAAPKLFSSMAALLPERGNVRLALYLQVEQDHRHAFPTLRAGLRVGDDRLYVIRHIPHFLDSMDRGEPVELGKGFTFVPEWMRFNDKDRDILQAFRALLAAQREGGQEFHGSETRLLPVPADFIDIFLRRVHYGTFLLSMGGENHAVRTVRRTSVPLFFRVEGSLRGLTVTGILPGDLLPLTAECSYVIMGGNIIEVDAIQREIIRAMWEEWTEVSEGESRFEYTPGETSEVVDTLLPFLKRVGVVELSEDLERMLVRLPLKARVYIDVDGRDITARTVFGYGEREIDPFTPARAQVTLRRGEHLLMRDSEAERQVMDTLAASGFGMTDGKVLLSGNEAVYTFVTEGVHTLRQHAEVFLSKDFSKFRPKPVRLKAHLAMRGPRLAMTFTDDTLPVEEARPILEAIARKKKYFRLKDGTFLDLTGLEAWQPFAAGVTESVNAGTDQAPAGEVNVWACQTFYLSSLLENLHAECTMDAQVQGMIQAVGESGEVLVLPERLAHYLRDYQLFGVKWLRTMDRLKMGGVLADDMGLGKTIQTIAMVATTLQEGEMALVVAPSSLTYNWQKEFSFFAPEIRTHVVSGANAQRMAFFADLSGGEIRDVDVLITSYPLIRRDIESMESIPFRLVFLDEAQQIKNAASTGAQAVKRLKARTRFALTGTPMENHAGELWSIFDFVLPGYLGSRVRFLRHYMDGQNTEELRRKIKPFLLRRMKTDVLDELPDKMETMMSAQMTPEQAKVYLAAFTQLRDRVNRALDDKKGANHVEVLSAIMQLRQICCHPSLVADNYTGSSGKMEMLMDILHPMLMSGRRVLVFSPQTP